MALTPQLRRRIATAAAAARIRQFSAGAPVSAFPGVGYGGGLGGLSATGAMPRVAREVERAIEADPREAMQSRVATKPGPLPTRLLTGAGKSLDPTKIERIITNADFGIALYEYADLGKALRERDTHILAVDRKRRQAVANKAADDYLIRPSDDSDPIAVALAHLQRAAIRGIDNFPQAVYSALSKNCDGYSLSEIIWHPGTLRFRVPSGPGGGGKQVAVEGLWPRSIEWVHARHVEFDTAAGNSDEPMLNVGTRGAIHLPRHKFIYSMASGEGIASARGYLRSVVWMHFFKHASWRDWVVFLHLYGIPFLQGKIDRSKYKDDTMLGILEHALEVYGTGEERPILPNGMEVEVHDAVSISGSGEAHKAMVGMCNAEISKGIEGVTLNTEAGGPGSYALGYVHQDGAHENSVGDAVTTAADFDTQLHLSIVEVNADAIARALAEVGLSVKPWDLPSRTANGRFRMDREWTPEGRQKIFSQAPKDGVPISMAQYRHALDLDEPTSEADTIRGEAVPVPDGAKVVGAADASKGVDNPKDPDPRQQRVTEARGMEARQSKPSPPNDGGDKE